MRATLSTMWLSEGKLPRSATIVLRPGRSRAAATSSLNRLTEMVSVTVTWCGAAPSSGASLAPMRPGDSYHPAAFQERIRPVPHSSSIVRSTRAATPFGTAPSELPSR